MYSNCWNISDEYGEQKSIDLSKVEQWKVTKESEVTSRNEEDLLNPLFYGRHSSCLAEHQKYWSIFKIS